MKRLILIFCILLNHSNLFSQCTDIFIGGGSYINEISVNIIDCNGNVIHNFENLSNNYTDCIDLPESYSIELLDSYGDGWTNNILTIGDEVYTMNCVWPNCYNQVFQYNLCSGCTDETACNFNIYAQENDESCIYESDCNGICGGSSITDECGNCYDPNAIVEIETTTFNYSGTIETYIVPEGISTLFVEVFGAQGGNSGGNQGGNGAMMSGEIEVTEGQQLQILVGQQPNEASCAAGGGGGSFVVSSDNNPLIIAGGGSEPHVLLLVIQV